MGCSSKNSDKKPPTTSSNKAKPSAADNSVPAQAAPVKALFEAIASGDTAKLQRCFTTRVHAKLAAAGWDKVLAEYRRVFKTFGKDWKPAQFGFRYEGDAKAGKVHVSHPRAPSKMTGMRVFREDGQWKLDER